jgi:solute carrier family 39 (zinc transporter), member 1/2/3
MNDVDTFKLVAGGVIWAQAVVGGLAPLVLKDRISPIVTSVLNMFAGGIFLAGSTMHLLPDAQGNEALAAAGCIGEGKCLQLAYFFYAIGFLMVMMLEVLAHAMQRRFGGMKREPTATSLDEHTPLVINIPVKDLASQVKPKMEEIPLLKIPTSNDEQLHATAHGHSHEMRYGLSGMRDPVNGLAADDELCADMEVTHAHIHGIMDANPALAFIIFIALSFHSVMEGMGVGAANGAAWDILIAILAHKSLAAFALVLELLHHQVPRRRLLMTIGIFSLMSPLGIFLGWLLVDATKETVASGICSAMAGGTFLFVAVMETIPQELQNQKWLTTKCFALLAGFFSMGLLSIWT